MLDKELEPEKKEMEAAQPCQGLQPQPSEDRPGCRKLFGGRWASEVVAPSQFQSFPGLHSLMLTEEILEVTQPSVGN